MIAHASATGRRVAITYHYSLAFGGSERVIEVLADMYPDADFFALIVDERFLPEKLKGRKITTSFLDRLPGARHFHRYLLPLYPLAVENLDLSGYDLVISADGAATKGVLTDQEALHICYCHSPPRSIWDQYAANRREMPWWLRTIFAPASQYLRLWDGSAAQRIDGFIANSNYVAGRIWKYYRRESTVIYPPVPVSDPPSREIHGDFYFSAGRLVPAKRTEVLIAACNKLGRRLRIAGTGPEEASLRAMAGPTIEFLGRISEEDLRQNYARCRALLFAAEEDFGLVSVEAQSFGRPVIAYGRGGSLEAVNGWAMRAENEIPSPSEIASSSGIFFADQTPESLALAIRCFERVESSFDAERIREHAKKFDRRVFAERFHAYVAEQWSQRNSHRNRHLSMQ